MLPAMGSSLAALYALNFINSDNEVAKRFSNPPSKNLQYSKVNDGYRLLLK